MAVTVIDSPENLNPAFNPNYWVFDSDKKTEDEFRYIVKVKKGSDVLATYKLRPVPDTLYGVVDIQKVLQQQFKSGLISPSNHLLEYSIDVDEEYIVKVLFLDYEFAGAIPWANYSDPSVNPTGATQTMLKHIVNPNYSAGDSINIEQIVTSSYRSELEGVQTVLDVFTDGTNWYTVLNLPWIGSGPASAGYTTYADGKKSIVAGITTPIKKAFRGAISFKNYIGYNGNDYIITNLDTRKFITSLPQSVELSRLKPHYIQFYKETNDAVWLVFNIQGRTVRRDINGTGMFLENILPELSNLDEELIGGVWSPIVDPIDLSDVKSYSYFLTDSSGVEVSETRTVNLYSECDYHDTFDIMFLDRLGSYITLPFYKGSYINQEVDKQNFTKKYGGLVSNNWTYSLQDRGVQTYHVEEKLTYTVNTGQLSQEQCLFFRELNSTPESYVSINGGDFEAIDIVATNIPLHVKRTQRDRKYSVKFTKSVQDNING